MTSLNYDMLLSVLGAEAEAEPYSKNLLSRAGDDEFEIIYD